MNRGLVIEINIDEEENKREAVILLDTYKTYVVPLDLLPSNIQLEDFVLMNDGKFVIDPSTDDIKEQMLQNLKEYIEYKKKS